MSEYTALPVPFGTVFFTKPTLKYMWDRRRTCPDFLTQALVARGCPITLDEVTWWIKRFKQGPTDDYTFKEFLAETFLPGYTLTRSLTPKWSLHPGAFYVNANLRTTNYGVSDMASIFNSTKSAWVQDFFVLKFSGMAAAFESARKNASGISSERLTVHDSGVFGYKMATFPVVIPPDEWIASVDSAFLKLLKSTCAEDYISAQMDAGDLLYSAIRPFIPPEKFAKIGLTENPWGIPVAVMRMLDQHASAWPDYMQACLDDYMNDSMDHALLLYESYELENVFQRSSKLTLAYGLALKDTVKKFAPNDVNLNVIAENFLRFSQNIAATNKKLRDMQDKAFTASVVGMIAGMAIGWGLSHAFGPFINSMVGTVSSTAGNVAGLLTKQLSGAAIKELSGALVGTIVSPPQFDPPQLLASLPMPDSPVSAEAVARSRELSQAAVESANEALSLALARSPSAPQALDGALQQSKIAFEKVAVTRDQTSIALLEQAKAKMNDAFELLSDPGFVPSNTSPNFPQLPGVQYPALPDSDYSVVTAGTSKTPGAMLLALVAVGFALAIPLKDKK